MELIKKIMCRCGKKTSESKIERRPRQILESKVAFFGPNERFLNLLKCNQNARPFSHQINPAFLQRIAGKSYCHSMKATTFTKCSGSNALTTKLGQNLFHSTRTSTARHLNTVLVNLHSQICKQSRRRKKKQSVLLRYLVQIMHIRFMRTYSLPGPSRQTYSLIEYSLTFQFCSEENCRAILHKLRVRARSAKLFVNNKNNKSCSVNCLRFQLAFIRMSSSLRCFAHCVRLVYNVKNEIDVAAVLVCLQLM